MTETPRAVLFDWDNTLIDSWNAIHHALSVTLHAMGHQPWSFKETRTRVRASARDSFPLLFGSDWKKAMAIFYQTFEADHLEQLRECPGAGEMLARLHARGFLLGIVSNKRGDLLRREADQLGWTPLFHSLVGANDAVKDKPAVDAVDLALRGSGLTAGSQIWFVGDTDIDMLCAANAGCVPVLLRDDPPEAGEFVEARPRHHIAGCLALAELIPPS